MKQMCHANSSHLMSVGPDWYTKRPRKSEVCELELVASSVNQKVLERVTEGDER